MLLKKNNFRIREKARIVEDVMKVENTEIGRKVVIEIENNMKVKVNTEEADH